MLVNIQQRKRLRELEDKLHIIAKKVIDPLSIEDLLTDTVVETAFPNIRWLLKIYILIPSSEPVVERGFLKMGQKITKNVHHWKITVWRC